MPWLDFVFLLCDNNHFLPFLLSLTHTLILALFQPLSLTACLPPPMPTHTFLYSSDSPPHGGRPRSKGRFFNHQRGERLLRWGQSVDGDLRVQGSEMRTVGRLRLQLEPQTRARNDQVRKKGGGGQRQLGRQTQIVIELTYLLTLLSHISFALRYPSFFFNCQPHVGFFLSDF